ncbi:M20/M25/M40 family metallo-hydrolase [Streptomyces sp. NBC_00654]|uniref:M20/M25/M40 family metallo-hydrolase n=1 Tax=Streptomyces sp. NBC_00654 TaxID=2975799 RepID=UPI0022511AAC|nr:M20/M25/M40 family metallo-hydrolase [Streptomyces sp. NBC_00654]MCX4967569.1 M20/M25/M40 family metallo-hydrolase [Streptomyces sp. NBC_00654]
MDISRRIRRTGVVLGLCAALAAAPAAAASPPPEQKSPHAPVVTTEQVMPHLRALQAVADRTGGNRAHGTRGFQQSLTYVKGVLDRAGFRTSLRPFTHNGAPGYNLIADWPGGDPDHVVLVGAHLDSVEAGPGMNDNGSGSAAVLATAVAMSRAGVAPERHLRFAWWGAEEQGLIGSKDYVGKLSAAERKEIDVYLNFDMTGTRSVRQWLVVHDEPRATEAFEAYFAAEGLPTFDVGIGGSDHESFGDAGIPVSGFSTGLGDCYHDACDRIGNVDPGVQTLSANAVLGVTWQLVTH